MYRCSPPASLPSRSRRPRRHSQNLAAKAVGVPWTFTLLDVGMEQGIFAKYGLDVSSTDFAGDAKLHQAFIAGSIDVALGSGPSMALGAKSGKAIAVAAFAGAPRNIAIIVDMDSPIRKLPTSKASWSAPPPKDR